MISENIATVPTAGTIMFLNDRSRLILTNQPTNSNHLRSQNTTDYSKILGGKFGKSSLSASGLACG